MKHCLLTILDLSNPYFVGAFSMMHLPFKGYTPQNMINSGSPEDTWDYWALVPAHQQSLLSDLTLPEPFKLMYLNIPKRNDVYYNKFLVSRFLMKYSQDYELCFYLDYDHLWFSQLKLPATPPDLVWVSSEVNLLTEFLNSGKDSSNLSLKSHLGVLNNKHFNNSIILSRANTLNKIMPLWEELYEETHHIFNSRFVEEISFSLAVIESGCRIQPVETTLQSNWKDRTQNCQLFHYGGDHPLAIKIKKLLNHKIFTDQKILNNKKMIVKDILNFLNTKRKEKQKLIQT